MCPHPRGVADHKVEALRFVQLERVADPHIPLRRFASEAPRETIACGLRTNLFALNAGQCRGDLRATGVFRAFQNPAGRFQKNALATAHVKDSAPTLEGKTR